MRAENLVKNLATGRFPVNERGSTTLLTMMLVSLLTLFCMYTLLFARAQYVANLSRARAYLCMKTQISTLEQYTSRMKVFNRSISISYKLSFIPKVKALHRALQVTQSIYHISFLKKFMIKGRCHFSQRLPFLYKFPYQHRALVYLKRNYDGAVKISKDQKWEVAITNYTAAKYEKPAFVLRAEFNFKNESLKLVATQEEAIKEWALSQASSYLDSLVRLLPPQFRFISRFIKNKQPF
ncbi:MAG: hypothetical protein ACN6I6_00230 [bacterium]